MTKTGVRTFEAASFLKRSGADITRVRKMFRMDMELYKQKVTGVRNADIFMDCYAIGILPSEGVNFTALDKRFNKIWLMRTLSQ